MSRVKMNAKHEYEFLANFKILQNVFKAKKVDKVQRFCLIDANNANGSEFGIDFSPAYTRREARQMQNAVRIPCGSKRLIYLSDYSDSLHYLNRDNLEFLQWIRRFWDANASGEPYDAAARRKGGGAEPPATIAPVAARSTGLSVKSAATGAAGRRTPLGGAIGR